MSLLSCKNDLLLFLLHYQKVSNIFQFILKCPMKKRVKMIMNNKFQKKKN